MKARDLMTTPVLTVRPETTLKDAATLLWERRVSGLPVVDADGNLVGMVSEADLLSLETDPDPRSQIRPPHHAGKPAAQKVAQVMTREVLALSEDSDTAMIAIEMLRANVKRIPIVREGKVVGIVSRHDLVRLLTRPDAEIEADLRELLDRERLWAEPLGVSVTGGVAEVRGPADAQTRRLIEVLARTVPGVIEVSFPD